jgi:hypothetical protein
MNDVQKHNIRINGPSSQTLRSYGRIVHDSWVPCRLGMARPQVSDGGDSLQVWRVAANILNKQSRTVDKGLSSSLGLGVGL